MQLYLIRHAQSENNVIMDDHIKDYQDPKGVQVYENQRFADAPLSRKGRKQAEKLGEFLTTSYLSNGTEPHLDRFRFNDFEFTHFFVSPMLRTLDTAKPFIDRVDIQPVIWEELHEQGGVWNNDDKNGQRVGFPGLAPDYIKANYPDYIIPSSMNKKGWWNRPYEEPEECYRRSGRVLEKLVEKHGNTDHKIGMVTHSYFINCLFYQLFNLSAVNREFMFVVNNTSICRIDFIRQRRIIVYQNRSDFLSSDLIT